MKSIIFPLIGISCSLALVFIIVLSPKRPPLRDYQLEIRQDSIFLYDGNKLIGTTEWDNNGIERMIELDNQ